MYSLESQGIEVNTTSHLPSRLSPAILIDGLVSLQVGTRFLRT